MTNPLINLEIHFLPLEPLLGIRLINDEVKLKFEEPELPATKEEISDDWLNRLGFELGLLFVTIHFTFVKIK